jgi:hypothetical protein
MISEISDLSHDDGDSADHGDALLSDNRFPLHFHLLNEDPAFEGVRGSNLEYSYRSYGERMNEESKVDPPPPELSNPARRTTDPLSEPPDIDQYGNPIANYGAANIATDEVARPPSRKRAARRGSMSSQVSITSHRYFNDANALPYASKRDSALLFIDVSGFTRLSTLLDPESLSRAINEYFELLVNEVTQHHGDIIKFAGDALFAEWQVSSNRSIITKSIESNVGMTLEDCVAAAAICGTKIVSKYCDYIISANPKASTRGRNKRGGRHLL